MSTRQTIISSARPSATLWLAAAGWLIIAVAAMIWIAVYSNSPGGGARPPGVWPPESGISRIAGRPTLVMFVHPRCPCSRASVGELARLLVQDRGLGRVQVLCVNPPGKTKDWATAELWEQAARIPGVTVALDQDGVEAGRFGVETSGQTLLYGAGGGLQFHGGITLSRGHSGDNPGRTTLESLLAQPALAPLSTPTFGCPLFTAGCGKGMVACNP